MSNSSDRNSVLTGKSDIPFVQIHPPSDHNTRTTNGRSYEWNPNSDRERNQFVDRRNQRNMGSDRRNKRYNGTYKDNTRYPESDKGYNSDKMSVSSSYLSPSIQRSQPSHNKQNGNVPRSRSPNGLDDVVLATQKQYTTRRRPRSRPRHRYRYNHGQRKPLSGTTPDKTVFPEKITLKIGGIPSPNTSYNSPKKTRGNGTVVMGSSLGNPHWKQNGHKPPNVIHSHDDDDIFENDGDDDDAYSSNSSWIGIPWHSYKLPPVFQDPNADEELSV